MNIQELEAIIRDVKDNIRVEDVHLDLKRKWYDFTVENSKLEFIKDIVAMANSRGDGERNIVIGIDEKNGELFASPLTVDDSTLQQMILDNVDPPVAFNVNQFDIEDKKLSSINIPASNNRPHIIKEFKSGKDLSCITKNYIPIRKGTTTSTVNRADLDEMYSNDLNKNKVSSINIELIEKSLLLTEVTGYFCLHTPLRIDNKGNTPISIVDIEFVVNDIHISNRRSRTLSYPNRNSLGNLPKKLEVGDSISFYLIGHIPKTNFEHFCNSKEFMIMAINNFKEETSITVKIVSITKDNGSKSVTVK